MSKPANLNISSPQGQYHQVPTSPASPKPWSKCDSFVHFILSLVCSVVVWQWGTTKMNQLQKKYEGIDVDAAVAAYRASQRTQSSESAGRQVGQLQKPSLADAFTDGNDEVQMQDMQVWHVERIQTRTSSQGDAVHTFTTADILYLKKQTVIRQGLLESALGVPSWRSTPAIISYAEFTSLAAKHNEEFEPLGTPPDDL